MRNFLKEIKEKVLVFDGSKGTMLQRAGLKGGECPELWNVTHRDEVLNVYKSYKDAGADVIQTNTFQGNRMKLEEYGLGERTYELNFEGVKLAREVMGSDGFVAASIGPLGKLFEPSGELTFECAYEIFKEQVKAVADAGADIINFETFTDLAEMRAALLAAKETSSLPVICSIAFESNGRTLMGTDPYIAAKVLKSLGADMIGTNCSFGPEHLVEIVREMGESGGISLCVKPNAGMPQLLDGKTVYGETPEKFARLAREFVKYGARLIGGCCGTTPDYIREIGYSIMGMEIPDRVEKKESVITSNTKLIELGDISLLNAGYLDSRIDSELFEELSKGNMEYIVDKALELSCEGYDIIHICIDNVKGDKNLLSDLIDSAQGYIREPFIIKTCDPEALDSALRHYKGKAGVIIENTDHEIKSRLLSAARKYGSTILD